MCTLGKASVRKCKVKGKHSHSSGCVSENIHRAFDVSKWSSEYVEPTGLNLQVVSTHRAVVFSFISSRWSCSIIITPAMHAKESLNDIQKVVLFSKTFSSKEKAFQMFFNPNTANFVSSSTNREIH